MVTFAVTCCPLAKVILYICLGLVTESIVSLIAGDVRLQMVTPVIVRIAEVLSAIHRAGFIHRDLKPGNIMMVLKDGRPEPLLADFGSAAARAAGDRIETTAEPSGSFGYMAPEQAVGRYHTSSDLYSFGVSCSNS